MSRKIIDLFSGAGGLTEGFREKGFDIVCHVEKDNSACETLRLRDYYYYLKDSNNLDKYIKFLNDEINIKQLYKKMPESIIKGTINKEINDDTLDDIFNEIDALIENNNDISGVIGGPPCQAYSTIGRAQNKRKKATDDRIYLYKYYIKFLKKYDPQFFVFENVKGLLSFRDINGEYLFTRKNGKLNGKMYDEFLEAGYSIDYKLINTKYYDVPQSRERIIIFGVKKDNLFLINDFFKNLEELKKESFISVKSVFSDLPFLKAGDTLNKYALKNPSRYIKKYYRKNPNIPLTQNISRKNNKRDLKIYNLVVQSKKVGYNLKYNELPTSLKTHKRENVFLDRYKALSWDVPSHTVVAHISKDGHHYIHPDIKQNRSITVREAARLQGFPDDYYFLNSRTEAFKQIGNAVPPIFSSQLATAICMTLE